MSTKNLDPSFQGAGQRIGTEIWRIENSQPVPLPKSDYGKFYSGDSYIILQTSSGKGGAHLFDIHFWLGKDTSQDEAAKAAIKSIELDAVIGGRAVQHRELQGFESDKFLSCFKPCIIPLEGGLASGFKKLEEEEFETRLYVCKGKHVVKVKQVPFSRSSLNHDDVFILDTEKKIFQFNGANSNTQEKAKSLEVIRYLKDKYHKGTCDVAIVDDGKLVAESDSGEFWVLLGGYAPIGKKASSEDDAIFETTSGKLYSIHEGQLKLEGGSLLKSSLENNKCFLLDCGSEVFLWVGRVTQLEERKTASQAAEEFLTSQDRPKSTRLTRLIQGYESQSFKSKFESWPVGTTTTASEEGRGKVAALLKQQGVDLKGSAKSTVNEEVPPLLESGGKLEVWRINGNAKNLVSAEDLGKFYCGDCYIILYTYHSGDKKEEYFLSCWIGKDSIEDDRATATRLSNTICNSLKGRPVQGRIMQGKEPPQFIALFQPMVILKGGISSGYKKYVAEKAVNDETYTLEGIALVQISNTSIYNNKAIQVDALATSLNSYDCFLLQSGSTIYTWHGNNSTYEQQHWTEKVAEFLRPGIALKHAKEGTETSAFWFALNGKQNFTSKKLHQESVRDPHLYIVSSNKGKLEVSEIYNFSQDDLLTEDILILDTHSEVFIWIGYSVDLKEKQNAFDLGQKYIENAVNIDGLSPEVPLYKITEGNEPSFFTTYFSWDNAKAVVFANSYAKKLSLLFGTTVHGSESPDRSSERIHGGPTQRASAIAALNSAFNTALREVKVDRSIERNPDGPTQRASALAALTTAFNPTSTKSSIPKPPSQGSQRAAAVAALSGVLVAEKKTSETSSTRFSRSPSPERPKREDAVSEGDAVEVSSQTETTSQKEETVEADAVSESNDSVPEASVDEQQTEDDGCQRTFSYERLRAKSTDPVKGIDYKRRETYLSDSEFQTVFGMPKDAFYRQPKWKQDMQKRKADMF